MATRSGRKPSQIRPLEGLKLPQIRIPGLRYLFLVPAAVLIFVAVIAVLGLINPPEPEALPNGMWLTSRWTYQATDEEIAQLARTLRDNRVGEVYAYISSLKEDTSWSGDPDERNRFSEVEDQVRSFVERLREASPDLLIYGWIEVRANTPEGYRLDSPQIHRIVADFSARAVNTLDFDGVFIDVKPLFDGNEDYLTMLRTIRGSIGLTTPMVVSVPPDLTPVDVDFETASMIAPGTVLDSQYKQRIALQADQLVVTAYNSYIDDPVNYIQWVGYQVESYRSALSEIEVNTPFLISIPNYTGSPPAHVASVETMAAALDGIWRVATQQERPQGDGEEENGDPTLLRGVAIFSDRDLTPQDWGIYREKWLFR